MAVKSESPVTTEKLSVDQLRQAILEMGADDVGFVSISRPEVADQRDDILRAFPRAQTLISIVTRLNREPIRNPARSVANLEFHANYDHLNVVARKIVRYFESRGVAALNPAAGFPMEMDNFPGKIWVVSHKPVAVAAGLGRIGLHRNVIHPRFGSFINLATILIAAEVDQEGTPLNQNPCIDCKLCVVSCPVGAISNDGRFNFSACSTHNYRDFMSGFTSWTEDLADSANAKAYRTRIADSETASMWQSLAFGPSYKAAYCISVCPAGEDVIGQFTKDRRRFFQEVVRPLQSKKETLYVTRNSDAIEHAKAKFPHKQIKITRNSLRPKSVAAFLQSLPIMFQPNQAKNLEARYHFTFQGRESALATVVIKDGKISVSDGHSDTADVHITADSATWIRFLHKNCSLFWALLTRRIRVSGQVRLLKRFSQCFPA